jgi:hypothetical protein
MISSQHVQSAGNKVVVSQAVTNISAPKRELHSRPGRSYMGPTSAKGWEARFKQSALENQTDYYRGTVYTSECRDHKRHNFQFSIANNTHMATEQISEFQAICVVHIKNTVSLQRISEMQYST